MKRIKLEPQTLLDPEAEENLTKLQQSAKTEEGFRFALLTLLYSIASSLHTIKRVALGEKPPMPQSTEAFCCKCGVTVTGVEFPLELMGCAHCGAAPGCLAPRSERSGSPR